MKESTQGHPEINQLPKRLRLRAYVTRAVSGIKQLLAEDDDFLRADLQSYLRKALESEMTTAPGASKSERVGTRFCSPKNPASSE